jgi:formylmethanofuran dehydrogenase subunit B
VEGLLVLRTLVLGRRLDPTRVGSLDLGLEALRWLARRLRSADYAVIVRDGDPRAPGLPIRAELLNRLARDARRHARVRILTLRPGRNAAGAERVLTWLTGFPSAVSFAGGEPRHDPHLWGAEAALAGGAADAAVVVGADPAKWLSPAAQARLRSIPVVAVGWGPPEAEVFIEAEPLSSNPGHLFRMDGLVLRQAFQGTDLPTEAEVLRSITGAVAGEAAA